MDSSWKKPSSKMVKPRPSPSPSSQEGEAAAEAAELAADQARLEKSQEDKVGDIIGGKWYITEWTDPILFHPVTGRQMTVSRFYPQALVAVDIFTFIGDHERGIIELKRQLFKDSEATYGGAKVKVRYAALSYADKLASILSQLEES